MKYYLIVGEASGDLHASNLMKALKKEDTTAQFRYWGGDLMQAVGGDLVTHYREMAFMGIWEVLKNINTVAKKLRFCKEDIAQYQPDVLILVDYSGFNLQIAKWAKANKIKIFYYISPQIWASRQHRVHKIKKWVDKMFVILPFEKEFYNDFGIEVEYVGHPLLDAINAYQFDKQFLKLHQINQPIIALLPGSRKQEVRMILEKMLPLVKAFNTHQFVIAVAPAIPISFYENIFDALKTEKESIKLVQNQTYDLLNHAEAALVTSGTATLETALFEVPQVVCYKGNWLTYQIAKRLIKVPYISLVNLIAKKMLVKELIQENLTIENLTHELNELLKSENKKFIKNEYKQLKSKLGNEGASTRAAKKMVELL
jgi:lipid-A-disaccharide synthase